MNKQIKYKIKYIINNKTKQILIINNKIIVTKTITKKLKLEHPLTWVLMST